MPELSKGREEDLLILPNIALFVSIVIEYQLAERVIYPCNYGHVNAGHKDEAHSLLLLCRLPFIDNKYNKCLIVFMYFHCRGFNAMGLVVPLPPRTTHPEVGRWQEVNV